MARGDEGEGVWGDEGEGEGGGLGPLRELGVDNSEFFSFFFSGFYVVSRE